MVIQSSSSAPCDRVSVISGKQSDAPLPVPLLLIKGFVIGLGMILVAGFTGIIIMLVIAFYRLQTPDDTALANWPSGQMIHLKQGETIAGTFLSGKYLVLHTQKSGKHDSLVIHNASTGQLETQIEITRSLQP